jgi:beta-lactamase regulating signal transducer with metallopeptidase domain
LKDGEIIVYNYAVMNEEETDVTTNSLAIVVDGVIAGVFVILCIILFIVIISCCFVKRRQEPKQELEMKEYDKKENLYNCEGKL